MNKSLELQATDYAKTRLAKQEGISIWRSDVFRLIKQAYEQGWVDRDTNMWLPFKADKDGFADEQFLDKMLDKTPFVVRYRDGTIFAVSNDKEDWYEWLDEIRKTPQRFKWMQLPNKEHDL